ncbi:MAG: hypothetical protein J3R72DRAFT_364837 [Linnemannia gamsii]|nr:MAG: hypothetical protein J3R72DRAFT_364837 [Linnemannia gamsii]
MKRRKLDDSPTSDYSHHHHDRSSSDNYRDGSIYHTPDDTSSKSPAGSSRSSIKASPSFRNKSYVCQHPGCGKAYTKPSRLAEHELVHSGQRPFKCLEPGCDASFRREAHLATHHKSQHGGSRDFVCPQPGCTSAFHSQDKLIHRLAEEIMLLRPYACTWEGCTKRFAKHQKLKAHVCMVHEGRKPYPCIADGCDRSFQTPSKLRKHALSHSESKRYACAYPGCGEYFTKWSLLQKHTKINHKTTQCGTCGKDVLKRNLSAHTKIHDISRSEVPCTIEGCQKVFSTERTLATHIKVSHPDDSGPPQFKCEYKDCGQSFTFKHVLERHIRNTHTNPKATRKQRSDALEVDAIDILAGFDDEDEMIKMPFTCQVPGCNRRYTTEALLKRHLKSRAHRNEKGDSGKVVGLAVLQAMEQEENLAIQDMIALHLDSGNKLTDTTHTSNNNV